MSSDLGEARQTESEAEQAGYMQTVRLGANRLKDVGGHVASQARPWNELGDFSALGRPADLGEATSRIKKNFNYFRVNYMLIMALVVAMFMLFHPGALFILVGLLFLWMYLFLIRQDPVVLFGKELGDREKVWFAGGLTLFFVLFSNVTTVLFTALGTSLLGLSLHAAWRVPDDLFLDESQEGGFFSFLRPPGHQLPASQGSV